MTNQGPGEITIGDEVSFRRTVTEADAYLYASITQDLSGNHVNALSPVAREHGRIAHGTYMLGLMSTASSLMMERNRRESVSYGYDRVRFTEPVRFGDTITVTYRIEEYDPEASRSGATVRCTNQRGELVAIASHISKYIDEA